MHWSNQSRRWIWKGTCAKMWRYPNFSGTGTSTYFRYQIFPVSAPVLIFSTFPVTNFSGTSSGTYFLYNLCYSRIFQNYKELENYSTGWFFLTSVGAVYFTPAPAPGFHFFGQNWIISEAESNWKRSCQKYFLIDLWVGWMKLQEAAQLHWRQKIV